MCLATTKNYRYITLFAIAALFLSACDMPGGSSTQVALPQSGVSTPDVLLSAQAGELFNNGGIVYAILNIYSNNASSPSQSIKSNEITDQTTTQVSWNNVQLSGDISTYTFEVVWKSTRYKEEDNVTDISFAVSGKVPLQADNSTLNINNYTYPDNNADGTLNIDAIIASQDPLACVLNASSIGHCRLI